MKMQKQEQKRQIDSWTFNDIGRKFFVMKNKNLYKFKIHNIFSNQWHQSQQVELQRINEQTIIAAFNHKIQAVSYELTERQQKKINLRFKVKLEYLAGQYFHQDINLFAIEMNQAQVTKIQMEQISLVLANVERLFQKQSKSYQQFVIMQKGNIISNTGALWQFNLIKGKYLLQLTGHYILQKIYNGQVEQDYDQLGNPRQHQQHNKPLRLNIQFNKNEIIQLKSPTPNFASCYEYPYHLSVIIQSKYDGYVMINVDHKHNDSYMMSNNIMTAIPIIEDI